MLNTKSIIIIALIVSFSESFDAKSSPWMLTSEMIQTEGYPCETYTFKTSDGYILSYYRIPNYETKKPPVVMVHGLIMDSRDFLLRENNSFVYSLFDEGYDVWLVNMRYSQVAKHVSINRNDSKYWDFSLEENGAIDVAETIDQILTITKSKKIIYIGMSAGNIYYVIMCNLRPDLVDKIAYQISFAPSWFITEHQARTQELLFPNIMKLLADMGMNYIVFSNDFRNLAISLKNERSSNNLYFMLSSSIVGENWDNIDWDKAHMVLGRYMALTYKQFNHMIQAGKSGFSRYDFGPDENIKRYGTPKPPIFDVRACTATRIVYYGKNDKITPLESSTKLINALKGSKHRLIVRSPKSKLFNHLDFISGGNETDLFYEDVLKTMKKMQYL